MQSPYATPQEIAAFAARMLDDLAALVSDHADLSMLGYLVEIARDEARARATSPRE